MRIIKHAFLIDFIHSDSITGIFVTLTLHPDVKTSVLLQIKAESLGRVNLLSAHWPLQYWAGREGAHGATSKSSSR